MKSKYWIKLYHEILDDRKMGRMPDNLWRRAIELFLMAGELDEDGLLPPIDEIAWRLHQSECILESELEELESRNILRRLEDNVWLIVNFSKRQARASSSERQRRYRQRQRPGKDKERMRDKVGEYRVITIRKRDITYTVTVCNNDVTQIVDKDIDIITTTSEVGLRFIDILCCENFADPQTDAAFLTVLKQDIVTYSWQEVLEAILIAVSPERANGRSKTWAYVQGILRNGVDKEKPNGQNTF